ncbi:MAG: hypothetical protein ABFQ95_01410 [Pseudomonadota bacterium]
MTYKKIKKFYPTAFFAAIISTVFVLSGCENSPGGAKRPSASFDSAIFKGKKEGRR